MNTFTIYQNNSRLFDRICDSPPSLEDTTLISSFLERSKFSSIIYYIDIIHADRHAQIREYNQDISKFMSDFVNFCNGKYKYGVVMYLN